MKLVKFVPAIAATLVLAACSTASDMASSVTNTVSDAASTVGNTVSNAATATGNAVKNGMDNMKNTVMATSKTVVYSCQKGKEVVASYEFEGEKATGLTLTVNNVAVKSLMRDDSNNDFASFVSKTHVWNVDTGFALSTYDQKDGVTLFKKGKKSDEILAKDCQVNAAMTAKLNK